MINPLPKSPTIHQTVQQELRRYILDNQLRPGDAMPPEGELAQQFGISRTSVREAVKALVSLGMLETRRGSGVFVSPFSLSALAENLPYSLLSDLRELGDLLELRRVLETGLLERAITAMTERTKAELADVVAEMRRRAARGESVFTQDRDFHRLLFADAGNQLLLDLLDAFWIALHHALAAHQELRERPPAAVCADHEEIHRAVAEHDVDRARRLLENHYTEIAERIGSAS